MRNTIGRLFGLDSAFYHSQDCNILSWEYSSVCDDLCRWSYWYHWDWWDLHSGSLTITSSLRLIVSGWLIILWISSSLKRRSLQVTDDQPLFVSNQVFLMDFGHFFEVIQAMKAWERKRSKKLWVIYQLDRQNDGNLSLPWERLEPRKLFHTDHEGCSETDPSMVWTSEITHRLHHCQGGVKKAGLAECSIPSKTSTETLSPCPKVVNI